MQSWTPSTSNCPKGSGVRGGEWQSEGGGTNERTIRKYNKRKQKMSDWITKGSYRQVIRPSSSKVTISGARCPQKFRQGHCLYIQKFD